MFPSHDNEDEKSQSQRDIVLPASLLSVEYAPHVEFGPQYYFV